MGKTANWSRGNGWVLAALVRVLDIMPEDAVGRTDYLQTFEEMCAGPLTRATRGRLLEREPARSQ